MLFVLSFVFSFLGLLLSLLVLLLRMQSQQVTPAIEISLQYNANALGVKTVLGEVAVIGLVVNPHGEVAVGIDKILKVKVAVPSASS